MERGQKWLKTCFFYGVCIFVFQWTNDVAPEEPVYPLSPAAVNVGWKELAHPHCGLQNMGNTCFISAVIQVTSNTCTWLWFLSNYKYCSCYILQALFHVPSFVNLVQDHQCTSIACTTCCLARLLQEMALNLTYCRPVLLLAVLKGNVCFFLWNTQLENIFKYVSFFKLHLLQLKPQTYWQDGKRMQMNSYKSLWTFWRLSFCKGQKLTSRGSFIITVWGQMWTSWLGVTHASTFASTLCNNLFFIGWTTYLNFVLQQTEYLWAGWKPKVSINQSIFKIVLLTNRFIFYRYL